MEIKNFPANPRQCRKEHSKAAVGIPPVLSLLSGWDEKQKNTKKLRTSEIPYMAEMTGDSCLACAVVLRTAAAVNHADTELIGHRGAGDTGFLCSGASEKDKKKI